MVFFFFGMGMKNILAAWSGGLDSTYMVWDALNRGDTVHTIYLEIVNNNRFREKQAIKEMVEMFHSDFPSYIHLGGNSLDLKCYNNQNIALNQAIPFLYNLFTNACSKKYDEVHIGYVMNDDALSYIPEIIRVWNSFEGLLYHGCTLPKLCFPIIKHHKQFMWKNLPESYKNHIVWCEGHTSTNCGECPSCKRMINIGLMEPVEEADVVSDNIKPTIKKRK